MKNYKARITWQPSRYRRAELERDMRAEPGVVLGHVLQRTGGAYETTTRMYCEKINPRKFSSQIGGSGMSGTRPGADEAYASPGRMRAAALGLAGVMVLAATCVACGGGGGGDVNIAAPPPPAITSISPGTGSEAGGEKVTIVGTSFSGATEVEFGNVKAKNFTVYSYTKITTISPPAKTAGSVYVTVVTPDGSSENSSASIFKYAA